MKLGKARLLLMDELAIHKGQSYATAITDAETRRVFWVGKGCGREDIRPFFDLIGKKGCKRIQAVGMDMSAAFEGEAPRLKSVLEPLGRAEVE